MKIINQPSGMTPVLADLLDPIGVRGQLDDYHIPTKLESEGVQRGVLCSEIRYVLFAMRDSTFDQVILRDSLSFSMSCVKDNAWANDFDNRLTCEDLLYLAGSLAAERVVRFDGKAPFCPSKCMEDVGEFHFGKTKGVARGHDLATLKMAWLAAQPGCTGNTSAILSDHRGKRLWGTKILR